MSTRVGILIFDDVEELDFVGPLEVFGMAGLITGDVTVATVSERVAAVRCAKGLSVVPENDFQSCPALDVVVVPGGIGTRREVENATLIEWLRKISTGCRWVTSVCTGALLLHGAGLISGRRVTTHFSFVESLRARGNVEVLDGPRYVRDGNVVTAAGVSAGIDMAL